MTDLARIADQPDGAGSVAASGLKVDTTDADTVDELYSRIRGQILDGGLRAGMVLSQVKLAKQFGVNRTPLREALRMLQREGLIEAQYNRRVRVSELTTADLETLYAERIVAEAFGIRLTVGKISSAGIQELRELIGRMEDLVAEDLGEWELLHHRFHGVLVSGAGERMRARIDQLGDFARRYRRALAAEGQAFDAFAQGAAEHVEIVNACADGHVDESVVKLARHLARSALTMISLREPTYDPSTVREALRMVGAPPSS